jgi:hypothetical protein
MFTVVIHNRKNKECRNPIFYIFQALRLCKHPLTVTQDLKIIEQVYFLLRALKLHPRNDNAKQHPQPQFHLLSLECIFGVP